MPKKKHSFYSRLNQQGLALHFVVIAASEIYDLSKFKVANCYGSKHPALWHTDKQAENPSNMISFYRLGTEDQQKKQRNHKKHRIRPQNLITTPKHTKDEWQTRLHSTNSTIYQLSQYFLANHSLHFHIQEFPTFSPCEYKINSNNTLPVTSVIVDIKSSLGSLKTYIPKHFCKRKYYFSSYVESIFSIFPLWVSFYIVV